MRIPALSTLALSAALAFAGAAYAQDNPMVGGAPMLVERNIVEMPSTPPTTRPWSLRPGRRSGRDAPRARARSRSSPRPMPPSRCCPMAPSTRC